MAWIMGHVTKEELRKLREIGWEDEDAPKELVKGLKLDENECYRAFFVDNDVFKIMTGPDWEKIKE